MSNVEGSALVTALRELLREAYFEPENPEAPWFTDDEAGAGFLGTVETLSPEEASRAPYGGGDTIAAHCNHLAYHLSLANRAFQGEDAFASADWPGSWEIQGVNDSGWKLLLEQLAVELDRCLALLPTVDLANPMQLKGALALLAHGAWHLGAVRQLIPLVRQDSGGTE